MIEVGEYIRTKKGYMGKYLYKEEDGIRFEMFEDNEGEWLTSQGEITKHSKNIIDLIEVGDYVNGCEVMNIYKPRDIWEPIEVEINSKCTRCFLKEEIKTILTHELYEEECYKVGDIE